MITQKLSSHSYRVTHVVDSAIEPGIWYTGFKVPYIYVIVFIEGKMPIPMFINHLEKLRANFLRVLLLASAVIWDELT